MNTKININRLLPNPFRNIDTYQISRSKVDQLKLSFEATGYWPIIIARLSPERPGFYEQAYAHHRAVAYRELYGSNSQIEVIVLDLNDEAMIKMMAHENQQDWETSFVVEMETVQSVVNAYADGRIRLKEPKIGGIGGGNTGAYIRHAPSFVMRRSQATAEDGAFPYTSQTIGEFLGCLEKDGRVQAKIADSLTALELIETKTASIEMFIGLNNSHARSLLQQIRTAGERVSSKKRASYRTQAANARARLRRAQANGDTKAVAAAERDLAVIAKKFDEANAESMAAQKKIAIQLSAAFKQGKIGVAEATKITDRVAPFMIDRIIPNQAKFCKSLQRDIWKILSEKHDRKRYQKIRALIEHRSDFAPDHLLMIANALKDVSNTALALAKEISTITMKTAKADRRLLTSGDSK